MAQNLTEIKRFLENSVMLEYVNIRTKKTVNDIENVSPQGKVLVVAPLPNLPNIFVTVKTVLT